MGIFDDFINACATDAVNGVEYDANNQPFVRDGEGNPVPVQTEDE